MWVWNLSVQGSVPFTWGGKTRARPIDTSHSVAPDAQTLPSQLHLADKSSPKGTLTHISLSPFCAFSPITSPRTGNCILHSRLCVSEHWPAGQSVHNHTHARLDIVCVALLCELTLLKRWPAGMLLIGSRGGISSTAVKPRTAGNRASLICRSALETHRAPMHGAGQKWSNQLEQLKTM
jgi:hypothetical protein